MSISTARDSSTAPTGGQTLEDGSHPLPLAGPEDRTERWRLARLAHNAGANISAVVDAKTKRPWGQWRRWQDERQTDDDFRKLRLGEVEAFGIFNGPGHWRAFDLDATKGGPPIPREPLNVVLSALGVPLDYPWAERSQSGRGWHVWIRCSDELPERFAGGGDGAKSVYRGESLDGSFDHLELRWQSGHTVVAASYDTTLWTNSAPNSPPAMVAAANVVAAFLAVAQPPPERPNPNPERPERAEGRDSNTDLPGDDYSARGDHGGLLRRHGWTLHKTRHEEGREVTEWQKPGSTGDHGHATYNHMPGIFYVFSSEAAPFEMYGSHDGFGLYAWLEHGGDFRAAAADLRRQGYGKPVDPALLRPDHTQVGYAERLTYLYGDRLRYVEDRKRWAIYDDARWMIDPTEDSIALQRLTKTMLDETWEAAAGNPMVREEVARKKSRDNIGSIISLARSEPNIATNLAYFDTDPFAFNVQNGTLNLQTGELRPHSPTDLITRLSPVAYDATATCPQWLAFLHRIMGGNTDVIGYLQRLAGYAMAGTGRDQSLSIFYGEGANGKSTFLETLASMVGSYYKKTPTQTLLTRNRGGIPNDLAALKGARFVTANEIPAGGKLDAATVKDLTGEDTITARFLNAEWFDFRPVFTLVIYGNHKPDIDGSDDGIWRRVHMVPFSVQIPEHERDSRLREKLLAEEAPGILTWMLEGFRAWNERGLDPPEAILSATKEYREDMDSLSRFIEQCFHFTANDELTTSEITRVYDAWHEAELGERRGARKSVTAIGEALTKRKVGRRKSNGAIIRTGIKLSDDGQQLADGRHPSQRMGLRAH